MDLFDLPGLGGKDNTPGLKGNIFIAAEDAFAIIQGFKTTTAVGDSVTINGSHTFLAALGFIQVYSTQDTAMFKLDPVGERDGRGKKVAGEFFNPGNTKVAAEFDRIIKNRSCIVLVQTPDGTWLQFGGKGLGLEVLGSFDTGKLSGGRRGFTYKVEGYQNGLQFYEGDIVRPDGSKINALTGVVTP
ncbi:hypothetical protein [Hymenobacter terricola]|uniref:hypothetical protein n=1 Tax=Hymenobacter terricola TaxID=2819236 RepID=UPI001B30F47A|nr:hypothetical protein [Hymenobacter terricola]